ncbi:MAG TPA: DinB family protein [Ktedonobacteraceae bacterium]|jgi:hypothetical protein
MLDFSAVKNGSASFADVAAGLTKADLYQVTDEMIDTMQKIVVDATDADVVFVPQDPNANDTFGKSEDKDLAWTLGHVVVHVTASSEESAALALTLARGLEVESRSRYETPWESVTTAAQIHQRLEESRHMRKAMLDAWPEKPNLEITTTPIPQLGPFNAIGRFIMGLFHDADHIEQLKEIMRQAHEANSRA